MADNLISAMQPELRDRFMELKEQNAQYQVYQYPNLILQQRNPFTHTDIIFP